MNTASPFGNSGPGVRNSNFEVIPTPYRLTHPENSRLKCAHGFCEISPPRLSRAIVPSAWDSRRSLAHVPPHFNTPTYTSYLLQCPQLPMQVASSLDRQARPNTAQPGHEVANTIFLKLASVLLCHNPLIWSRFLRLFPDRPQANSQILGS